MKFLISLRDLTLITVWICESEQVGSTPVHSSTSEPRLVAIKNGFQNGSYKATCRNYVFNTVYARYNIT